jgi:hypothetical protein
MMTSEEEEYYRKDKPTYIMVPKRFITTWIMSFICLAVMSAAAIQWAGYVDRRSNQRWCGIVVLLDNRNIAHPPPTTDGKLFATKLHQIRTEFDCK